MYIIWEMYEVRLFFNFRYFLRSVKQRSLAFMFLVEKNCVAGPHLAHKFRNSVFNFLTRHYMEVIWHQAVSQNIHQRPLLTGKITAKILTRFHLVSGKRFFTIKNVRSGRPVVKFPKIVNKTKIIFV